MDIEAKAKELHDEFVKLIKDEREANDKKIEGRLPASDFKTFSEKLETRMTELNTEIAKLKKPGFTLEGKEEKEAGKLEYKKALFQYMRTGKFELNEKAAAYKLELKALVEDATGDILVTPEIDTEIYRALPLINVIRPLCAVRTIGKDKIDLRSITETEVGWGKLELGGAAPETTLVPSKTYQYVEDIVGLTKIGEDELSDSDVALEPIIADSFSRKIGDLEEAGFISGTGHDHLQPTGILNGTTVTRVTSAAANAVTFDDLLNLQYAVPAQYRKNGTFVLHSSTELALRLLRATTYDATHFGAYIWQPSVQEGKPNTVLGRPCIACDAMPELTDGTLQDVVIYGDFNAGYRILDRQGTTIKRLVELYSLAGLIGFQVKRRVGGSVVRADALRILQEHS